jgi:hypothetical protein
MSDHIENRNMGRNMGAVRKDGSATRVTNRLTAVGVRNLKKPAHYSDGGGLYLRVAKGGSKSWVFRFTIAHRTREMGLGAFPSVYLAAARDAAQRCRQDVAAGADPIEVRKAASIAAAGLMTFKQCALGP